MPIRFDDIGNRLKAFRLGSGLSAEDIVVLAGPISYVLASDGFDGALGEVLRESVPDTVAKNTKALAQIEELMTVLRQRKETYRRRRPAIVNLIAAGEMQRFLRNGMVGRLDLSEAVRRERRRLARAEAEHFTALMADEPIGVQIGIVLDTLPHTSFQIFRQPDRRILALSPFRLGEEPNIRVGVAMITSAPEALALHEKMARDLWSSALKGPDAVRFMRGMMEKLEE